MKGYRYRYEEFAVYVRQRFVVFCLENVRFTFLVFLHSELRVGRLYGGLIRVRKFDG